MAKKVSILIVDDEPDLVESLESIIEENFSLEILKAFNPMEGLELFHKNKNSIKYVISDYYMPGDNGIELLKVIKESKPDLRVILLTGNAEMKKNSKENLFVDYVHSKIEGFEGLINYIKVSEY